MFIYKQYQHNVSLQPNLTDKEFMVLQIQQLEDVFYNEAVAIKSPQLEYVALSDKFISAFDVSGLPNNKLTEANINLGELDSKEVREQEQKIINSFILQLSVYIFKKDARRLYYMMRKRPLINPATNNMIGILVIAARIEPWAYRKEYVKHLARLPKFTRKNVAPELLSQQQQQIVSCLLIGVHSRKEIAAILSDVTSENYNEKRVQNSLQLLYEKFDCSTAGQLINLIHSSQIKVEVPAISGVSEGNYIVSID